MTRLTKEIDMDTAKTLATLMEGISQILGCDCTERQWDLYHEIYQLLEEASDGD